MSEESSAIITSLSSLKKPAKKRTTRKSTTGKSTARKSTTSKSTPRKKSASTSTAKKRTAPKKRTKAKSASSRSRASSTRASTAKKRTASTKSTAKKPTARNATSKTTTKTTTRKRRTPTLRADLKKYAGESYSTDELVGGVTTILNREGTDILRDALMAYLAHKVPVMGEMINDSLVDDLIGKLTDDYGKVKAAERKGIRAVINWLDGEFDPGSELQSSLVHMLVQAESPASDTSEFSVTDFVAEPSPQSQLKPLR